MKKKNKGIALTIALGVLLVIGAGFLIYDQVKVKGSYQSSVEKTVKKIDKDFLAIQNTKDADKKLKKLKKLVKESEDYKNGSEKDPKVIYTFKTDIEKLRKEFIEENQKKLKEFEDKKEQIAKETDAKKVKADVEALEKFLKNLEGQEGIVYEKKDFDTIHVALQNLLNAYKDRLKELDGKEKSSTESSSKEEVTETSISTEVVEASSSSEESQAETTVTPDANQNQGTNNVTPAPTPEVPNNNWGGGNNQTYPETPQESQPQQPVTPPVVEESTPPVTIIPDDSSSDSSTGEVVPSEPEEKPDEGPQVNPGEILIPENN